MPSRIEMVGLTFGRLTIVSDRDNSGVLLGTPQYRLVVARCSCGSEKLISARSIRKGHAKSCGCLHVDVTTIHGLSEAPLYAVWRGMLARCFNTKNVSYSIYGGRGIIVCDEWREKPGPFVNWAQANGWRSGLHIDRINVNGNYAPDNCRFVTPVVNQNNKRTNRCVRVNGRMLTLADAERATGISQDLIRQRIGKLGWTEERAVRQPARTMRDRQQ